MKRILTFVALLALALPAWAAVTSFTNTGDTVLGDNAAVDTLTINAATTLTGALVGDAEAIAPDDATPDVSGGNIFITGINTVPTAITALDNEVVEGVYTIICGDIANASTIADAGNFALNGPWNPATIGDSIILYVEAADNYYEIGRSYVVAGPVEGDPFLAGAGAVGAPAYTYIADPDSGRYWVGANSFADAVAGGQIVLYDATGITVVGGNGPWGTVAPDDGTFTNVDVGGTFNFGQDPADLIAGYKEIAEYISYVETFDGGSDANLAADYNIATVVGAGTNTVTVLDGWNELVTGGAGGPDSEMTRSLGLAIESEDAPRIEGVVSLAAVAAGQTMNFGFWAAANRYVEIIHEPATSANWLLRIDDTAGAETEDSGVIALINTPTKLAITVTAGGVVDWSIDDVDMATVGITNLMTNANPHYWRFHLIDVAAAPHTAALDYVIIEKLKQQ